MKSDTHRKERDHILDDRKSLKYALYHRKNVEKTSVVKACGRCVLCMWSGRETFGLVGEIRLRKDHH